MGGCLSSVKNKKRKQTDNDITRNTVSRFTNKWISDKPQPFDQITRSTDSLNLISEIQGDKLHNLLTMDEKLYPELNSTAPNSFIADSDSKENCYPDLPVRKANIIPNPKKLLSCVPLAGISRSLSLPRRPHSPHKSFDSEDKTPKSDQSSKWVSPNILSQWMDEFDRSPPANKNTIGRNQRSCSFQLGDEDKGSCVTDTTSTLTAFAEDALSSNTFSDPILADLEASLPAPPPPPRACPLWLKTALQEKCSLKHPTTLNLTVPGMDYATSSLPSPVPQSCSTLPSPIKDGFDVHKSFSLENNRFSVRIYPVLQNGIKISDTHYWLLDPPRPKNVTGLGRRATECYRVPPPSPSSYNDLDQGYLNIDAINYCPSNEKPLRDIKLRRGRSEICRDSIKHFYRQLVQRLMKEVPMATEYECEAVLIGSSYNYDQALKRLKLELLCRNGYTSQPYGKRLLHKYNWNLVEAIYQARREYERKKVKCRREQSGISPSNLQDSYECDSSDFPNSHPWAHNSSEASLSPQSMHSLSESSSWLNKPPNDEGLSFPTVYVHQLPNLPSSSSIHHEQN